MGLRWLPLIGLALLTFSFPAAAQVGPGTLTKTNDGYDWTRGNITQKLRDCDSNWTQAEADIMKASFDKLPDVLLEYADEWNVEWRRSPRARPSLGRRSNAPATTVINSVTGSYISMADSRFAGMNATAIYRTVVHELGHVAQFSLASRLKILSQFMVVGIGTPGFTSISWTSAITDGLKSWNTFVSDYSRRGGDREDFAETVEYYWIAPDELLKVSPAKHQFMATKVYNGVVSPAASRVPGATALAPVTPEITSLGDQKDNAWSLVKIKGNYFMGPKDGGFNRVYYRTKRAVKVSVSRSTIYSWVPNIATGSAPITVETQDGTSQPKAFEVTKPWWR